MKKRKVLETLEKLPEDFDMEELVEKLLFIQQVEEGLIDSKLDRTLSLEEAKEKLSKKWQS
ncbi:hypothetical protein [Algoriphagus marinus]|uniref:hypothetical protein n=1 Tax=Algoriphagus marinus TaxID=1925762 RepID=UPI00094B91CB|nr:hypothetical protein [Algoriphagus marinus]